jgi:hypothetical protein
MAPARSLRAPNWCNVLVSVENRSIVTIRAGDIGAMTGQVVAARPAAPDDLATVGRAFSGD